MSAAIAGHVYTMLLESDTEADRIRRVSQELDRWLDRSRNVADDTDDEEHANTDAREFIFKYFSQLWKSDYIFDINSSFSLFLPHSRKTIASHMYMAALNNVPFLSEIDDINCKEILCSYMMYDFAMPGDILCGVGINDEIFVIIISGNGAILNNTLDEVTARIYSSDTLNNHILLGTESPANPVMAVAEKRTEFLFIERDAAISIGKLFPRVIEGICLRLAKNDDWTGATQMEAIRASSQDISDITSEIRNLEMMHHIPCADLELIERASKIMPMFCSKIALKTVQNAKLNSLQFETSMKHALKSMQDLLASAESTDGFVKLSMQESAYAEAANDDASNNEEVTPRVKPSQSRYGQASKKWKSVVKNFMNASRFSGIERYILTIGVLVQS
jgi:hypothetical protein